MPLVAHWPLEEDSGSTAYDVRGSNNGSTSGATVNASGINGKTAYTFDGTDDYVSISDSSSLDYVDVTVSAWIYRTDNSGWDFVFEQRNGNFNGMWIAGTTSADTATFHINDSGGTTHRVESASGSVPLNEWVHITGTYNGTVQRIYINGVESGSNSASFTPMDPNVARYIGAGQSNTEYYFNGTISDVRIYDHALSPLEVQRLYEYPFAKSYLSTPEVIK